MRVTEKIKPLGLQIVIGVKNATTKVKRYASPIRLGTIAALDGVCVPLNIADGKVGRAILFGLATVFFTTMSIIIGKDIAKNNSNQKTNDNQVKKHMDTNA